VALFVSLLAYLVFCLFAGKARTDEAARSPSNRATHAAGRQPTGYAVTGDGGGWCCDHDFKPVFRTAPSQMPCCLKFLDHHWPIDCMVGNSTPELVTGR
jgi:hypothetical protein